MTGVREPARDTTLLRNNVEYFQGCVHCVVAERNEIECHDRPREGRTAPCCRLLAALEGCRCPGGPYSSNLGASHRYQVLRRRKSCRSFRTTTWHLTGNTSILMRVRTLLCRSASYLASASAGLTLLRSTTNFRCLHRMVISLIRWR